MRFGLDFPPFGDLADPHLVAEIATTAEAAGWDGVFVWDHIQYREPVTHVGDPWILLAAIAAATSRVIIGPMVTPLPRRRPQVVARQTTTLDQLSSGRMVVGVGLGLDGSGAEFSAFGEELDDRTRAEQLDEALGLLDALWSGQTVEHVGPHYRASPVHFLPTPVQRPRPPIWVAARWPYRRPLRRAARWDGVFLIDEETPQQLAEAVAIIEEARTAPDPFEVVVNRPFGSDPAPWAEAGATWFLTRSPYTIDGDSVMEMARAGPHRDR